MVSTGVTRWLRHLCTGSWKRRRCFPPKALEAIEREIATFEGRLGGELRFAIECALSPAQLWRGVTPREAALAAFAQLGVWDTAHRDGVLIYLLLADHDVEIVVDRGVGHGQVPPEQWQAACETMRRHFTEGRFEQGAVDGIRAVAGILARYPSGRADAGNELPDRPAVI